ncbi:MULTISPECIES: HPr family phosphocarrier protein [Leifsonia]|jgi:phosphocarrier protein|uniref:Phosphocarrier, HPr family n=3 Tax=Leifsonia TaxID=110932 RepID=U2RM07_LEIAQ|nr:MULTISPECIES: HPr family phosphocarrier protein [Leifsonia]ERK69594.1 phosphocarrier, HPr family [Leifsonia aquatica ATCC 14665]MBB2967437.1 phosphocarrier protein [Leifsonia aquatica]NYK09691.1 phosphocarrier protein [Leifsonia naganoensis]
MAERIITVGSTHGLHARPAKLFVEAVKSSGAAVKLSKEGGKTVDAGSILGVISLGIDHGDKIVLTTDAADADAVLDDLADILTTDHDA